MGSFFILQIPCNAYSSLEDELCAVKYILRVPHLCPFRAGTLRLIRYRNYFLFGTVAAEEYQITFFEVTLGYFIAFVFQLKLE